LIRGKGSEDEGATFEAEVDAAPVVAEKELPAPSEEEASVEVESAPTADEKEVRREEVLGAQNGRVKSKELISAGLFTTAAGLDKFVKENATIKFEADLPESPQEDSEPEDEAEGSGLKERAVEVDGEAVDAAKDTSEAVKETIEVSMVTVAGLGLLSKRVSFLRRGKKPHKLDNADIETLEAMLSGDAAKGTLSPTTAEVHISANFENDEPSHEPANSHRPSSKQLDLEQDDVAEDVAAPLSTEPVSQEHSNGEELHQDEGPVALHTEDKGKIDGPIELDIEAKEKPRVEETEQHIPTADVVELHSGDEAKYKLCKVRAAQFGDKGVPHITTFDGRTIRYPDPLIKANDTAYGTTEGAFGKAKEGTDYVKDTASDATSETYEAAKSVKDAAAETTESAAEKDFSSKRSRM
jgi:hypothetical protein